jgi:NDP-sugar pyrophosphorylase family protein
MKEKELLHLPIISKKNKLIGLETLSTLSGTKKYDNAVFLMAGGFGKRLTPLTNQMPKPLLEVGTKPILEEILVSFINSGFHNFYISTHFMADKIRDYFRDGSEWGVTIKYIHEEKPLGTAGALSLLSDEEIDLPLIMMNGDLISDINFSSLLDYHIKNKAKLTMCISEYALKIPYGVIVKEDDRLIKIDEKPSHKFFINAGIYVINSDILKTVRKDTPIDMPTLIEEIISDKESVKVYPIHEYWLDIGQLDDFDKAKLDKKNK